MAKDTKDNKVVIFRKFKSGLSSSSNAIEISDAEKDESRDKKDKKETLHVMITGTLILVAIGLWKGKILLTIILASLMALVLYLYFSLRVRCREDNGTRLIVDETGVSIENETKQIEVLFHWDDIKFWWAQTFRYTETSYSTPDTSAFIRNYETWVDNSPQVVYSEKQYRILFADIPAFNSSQVANRCGMQNVEESLHIIADSKDGSEITIYEKLFKLHAAKKEILKPKDMSF